ncbi:MAG: RDD family protein [Pseudomonadota bacterium]
MQTMSDPNWALPHPDTHPEFYSDTVTKRFIAWIIDVAIIGVVTLIVATVSVIGWFFVPFLFATISFMYRWWSLAARSATPGMRLASVELRMRDGQRFDTLTALLHTIGYFVSVAFAPLQLISIVLMLMSARGQGLTDHVLGTAAINKSAAN